MRTNKKHILKSESSRHTLLHTLRVVALFILLIGNQSAWGGEVAILDESTEHTYATRKGNFAMHDYTYTYTHPVTRVYMDVYHTVTGDNQTIALQYLTASGAWIDYENRTLNKAGGTYGCDFTITGAASSAVGFRIYVKSTTSTLKTWSVRNVKIYCHAYSVTFNAQGGTCSESSRNFYKGETYGTLPTPSYPPLNFLGWYSAASGGTKFESNAAVAITSDQTWYAHWESINYTVSYNNTGSTQGGSMSNQSFAYNESKALSANAFTNKYIITYDAQGGTASKTSDGVFATFAGWEDRSSIVYEGQTFGYNTDPAFDAPYYANAYSDLLSAFGYNKYNLINHYYRYILHGSEHRSAKGDKPGLYPNQATVANLSTTNNATVNLYAHWGEASSTVVLPTVNYRVGYRFDGWYDAPVGGTKIGNGGDSWRPSHDVTIYAHYTPVYYATSYAQAVPTVDGRGLIYVSSRGNTPQQESDWVTSGKQDKTYNTDEAGASSTGSANITATYYAKALAGYKFMGWYTDAACTQSAGSYDASNNNKLTVVTNTSTRTLPGVEIYRYAKFDNVSVSAATAQSVSFTARTQTKTVTLSFPVTNASSTSDFNAPTVSGDAGWTVSSWTYANNTVSVVMSFTATENTTTRGNHVSTVTLSAKSGSTATGTVTATVNLTPAYANTFASSYLVGDAAIDLNTLWTSSSNGTKHYTITKFEASGSNNSGATAPAISGTTLSLGQAGKVYLTLTQDAGTSDIASSTTCTLTINKHDRAAFTWNEPSSRVYYYNTTTNAYCARGNTDVPVQGSSSNNNVASITASGNALNLMVYNVPGTATITVTQPETYYYYSKTDSKTFTPQKVANHVTFAYNEGLYNTYTTTHSNVIAWKDDYVRVGNASGGGLNYDDKWFDIHLTGIPESITFQVSLANGGTGIEWYVATSHNNNNYKVIWTSDYSGTSWCDPVTLALDSNVTDIRMCYSGNFAGDIKVIQVKELERFAVSPTSMNFGEVLANGTATSSKNFTFRHANAGYTVTASSNNPHFTVTSPIGVGNTGGDRMGEETATITFKPNNDVGVQNGVITLTDQLGHTATINVTGTGRDKLSNKIVATINGEQTYSYTYWYNSTFPMTVSSNNAVTPITVTQLTGSEFLTYNATTKQLTSTNQAGTATFLVEQAASTDYVAASDTVFITIGPKPEGCYLVYETTKQNLDNGDSYERTWTGTNVAGTLTMSIYSQNNSENQGIRVFQQINGEWTKKTNFAYFTSTEQTYNLVLDPSATGIRIESYTTLSRTNHITHLSVTRIPYLATSTPTLICPEQLLGSGATQATFYVNYSSCDAGNIYLACDNSKFTLSPETISVADGTAGSQLITVTYLGTTATTDHGNITISNQSYIQHATVTGTTFTKTVPTVTKSYGGRQMYITRDLTRPTYHDIAYLMREQFTTNNTEKPDTTIELVTTAIPAGVVDTDYNFGTDKRFYSQKVGTFVFRITHGETEHFASVSDTLQVTVIKFTPKIYWYLNDEEYVDGTYLIGTGHPAVTHGDVLRVACVTSIDSYTIDQDYADITLVADATGRTNGNASIKSPTENDVTVTLTANTLENDFYYSVSNSKTFTITRKLRQHIVWDDDLSALMVQYKRTQDGSAYTDEKEAQTYTLTGVSYDDENNPTGKTITYTITHSSDTILVPADWSITGNTFNYTSQGEQYVITATQNDQTDYAPAAPISKTLNVYDQNNRCDNYQVSLDPSSTDGGKLISSKGYRIYNLLYPSELAFQVQKDKDGAWIYNESRPFIVDFYDGSREGDEHSGRCTGNLIKSVSYSPGEIPTTSVGTKTYIIDNIPENARSVHFHSASDHGFRIFGVIYSQHQYVHPAVNQIEISTYSAQPSDPEKFSVNWMNTRVLVECTNPRCVVTPTSFGECGANGIARLQVVYNAPALPTKEEGEIIFRDLAGNQLASIPLTASVNYGMVQKITSFNVKPNYLTVDQMLLEATSDRGQTDFTYSLGGEPNVAYLEYDETTKKTTLKFYRSGIISVTAYQAGTEYIAPAEMTVSSIVVDKTPLIDLVPPTASDIDYGEPLKEATLEGGSALIPDRRNISVEEARCPGEYQWEHPEEIHTANYGNPQYLTVVYKPSHTETTTINGQDIPLDERYADTETEAAILINRITPSLTWTDDNISIERGDEQTLQVEVKAVTSKGTTIYLAPQYKFAGDVQLARFSNNKQNDRTFVSTLHALRTGQDNLTAYCNASQNFHAATPITKQLTVTESSNFAWVVEDNAQFYANTTKNFNDLVLGGIGATITIEAGGIIAETPAEGETESQTPLITDYVEIDNENQTVLFKKPTPYALTLTATAEGYPTETLNFTIIERPQYIQWDQYFYDNVQYDDNDFYRQDIELNAVAVDEDGKPTNQSITYQVADNSIAEIRSNSEGRMVLHFKKSGMTSITATAAEGGTNYYAPASASERICVYTHGYECNDILYEGSESLIGTIIGLNEYVEKTWDQENVADKLTFKAALTITSTEMNWVELFYRTEIGQDGQPDQWVKADDCTVISTWREFEYTLPSNVTGIRFRNPEGATARRAVTAIKITKHRYFYLSENEINVSHLGINVPLSRSFDVKYAANPLIKFGLKQGDELVTTTASGLTITPNRVIDNDCNYAGSYTFTLSGVWNEAQEIHETAVIYNAAGDKYEVPIYIKVENGKTFIFNLPEGGIWRQSTNWALPDGDDHFDYNHGLIPGAADKVEIRTALEINAPVEVYEMNITTGSVNIGPQGGLSVYQGGLAGATTENFRIESNTSAQGFFRMHPEAETPVVLLGAVNRKCPMPQASVEFATRGTLDTGNDRDATWQYIGVPSEQTNYTVPYISELYLWSESAGWVNQKTGLAHLLPFAGYAVTQYGKETYVWKGQLYGDDKTIDLTYTEDGMQGANVIANSYASPIDVKNFTADDITGDDATIDKTFYVFNSGSWNQWNESGQTEAGSISQVSGGNSTPGHYTAIPMLSAKDLDEKIDLTMIASMEGVYVQVYASGAQIKLDYEKHVWNASSSVNQMNYPARAPQWRQEQEGLTRLRLQVNSQTSGADYIYVLERPTYSNKYDNGYDAPKAISDNGTVNLYTIESYGQNAVSATNNADGLYLGFISGDDQEYSFTARSVLGQPYYLEDTKTGEVTLLTDSTTYHFSATPATTYETRFRLWKEDPRKETTSVGTINGTIDVVIDNDRISISNAEQAGSAHLYQVNGQLIADYTLSQHTTLSTSQLQTGVYVLQIADRMYKFVKK